MQNIRFNIGIMVMYYFLKGINTINLQKKSNKEEYISCTLKINMPNNPNRKNRFKIKGYKLVWSDEFEYEGKPNEKKWNYDIGNKQWANWERQAYTDNIENAYVKDGKLHIVAINKKDGECNYTSARLTTHERVSWKYGYFEIKAKMPKGMGAWPAIWMMREYKNDEQKEEWPDSGEIDIVEHCSRLENLLLFSLHSKRHNCWNFKEQQFSTGYFSCLSVCKKFHTYGMKWDENQFNFYVDGWLVATYKKNENEYAKWGDEYWPFDHQFYLIINLAIGGLLGGPLVDSEKMPFVMEVEYVRIYQKS